jgi:hypothetical protein
MQFSSSPAGRRAPVMKWMEERPFDARRRLP